MFSFLETLWSSGGLELLLKESVKLHQVDVNPKSGEDKVLNEFPLSIVFIYNFKFSVSSLLQIYNELIPLIMVLRECFRINRLRCVICCHGWREIWSRRGLRCSSKEILCMHAYSFDFIREHFFLFFKIKILSYIYVPQITVCKMM